MTKLMSLFLCAAMLVASAVEAKPAKVSSQALAEAKASFKDGTAAYDLGHYEDALRAFEHAHELSRNPVLYFNLAACAEKLGQPRVAAAHLRAYLAELPGAEDAVATRERLGALEERARQEEIRRAEDERRAEEEARRRKEDASRHKEDAPRRRTDEERRTSEPAAMATVEPAPPLPPSVGRRYAGGFALLGVTALFGVTAAGLGGSALAKAHDLDATCGQMPMGCGSSVDGVQRQAIAADVFFGLTGAAAVATIVLFALEARPPRRERAAARGGAL